MTIMSGRDYTADAEALGLTPRYDDDDGYRPDTSWVDAEPVVDITTNGNMPDPAPRLSLRWVNQTLAQPPPEPPVLVEGLLRTGELCVIGAPRAIGKSWMAMNLALLVSQGDGLFLGSLPIRQATNVLISQGELDEWGSWSRWQKLAGTRRPEGVAETFDRWRLRTVRRRSSSSSHDQHSTANQSEDYIDSVLDGRVETTIQANHFGLHIIDPWASYYAGAENSNDEVEAALDKLRDISFRCNTAVVVFTHFGKANDFREPEDLWRGASRLADWASTRVTLTPHYTPQQAKDQGMTRAHARRYVDVSFLRRSEPTDDFSIVWDPGTGWWDRWADPVSAGAARQIDMTPLEVAARCAQAGGWTSLRKAASDLDMSQETANRILGQAVRTGHLEETVGTNHARRFTPGDAYLTASDTRKDLQ